MFGSPSHEVDSELRSQGWPVMGVFVGGCIARGVGSSFRAGAHTHTHNDGYTGWICIRSAKRVLTPSGKPSRLLLHEVAHVLAPKATHGSKAFIAALRKVGIGTDTYSRAGRTRAISSRRIINVQENVVAALLSETREASRDD